MTTEYNADERHPDPITDPAEVPATRNRLLRGVLSLLSDIKLLLLASLVAVQEFTADGQILASTRNTLVIADATAATVDLTLPALEDVQTGYMVLVKRSDSTALRFVSVAPGAGDSLDGSSGANVLGSLGSAIYVATNASWYKVA